MNNELKIFAFLSIDDLCDVNTVEKQISDIKSLGFNGVVFHPRRYSGRPKYLSEEYMELVSAIILFAKQLDMQFWIYDENGWPSGSADGQVPESIPDLKCKWLEYTDGKVKLMERTAINSLDPRGVAKFIELTHEAYKNKLMPEAFDWVGGFFSDEVGFYIASPGGCGSDFILSGYPFAFEPVTSEKTLEGDISGQIKIDCAHIAAARVFIDGEDHGWIYPGSDIVRIIGAKQHSEITCVIYQSAYNLYGSHHHLEGDRPLVSPMQYTGAKNFADTPSLPENTYEDDIKLIKWQISDYVESAR